MRDIHTNYAPSKIVKLFSQTSSIHEYNTRSSSKNNMYINKFYLEKLRQAVPIFGAKVWNEISGRMRDMSKKVLKRKLISLLFDILKAKDDYPDETMITREIKSRNPKLWPLSQVALNRFVFLAFEFIHTYFFFSFSLLVTYYMYIWHASTSVFLLTACQKIALVILW